RGYCCMPLIYATGRYYPELAGRGEVWRLRLALRPWQRGSKLMLVAGGGLSLPALPWLPQYSWLTMVLGGAIVWIYLARDLETSLLNAARWHRPYALWDVIDAWARPLVMLVVVLVWGATVESLLWGVVFSLATVTAMFCWFLPGGE